VETEKWLTLSEVIHQANLDASEARRLVGKFSRFLAPRNFGDIIKYPPTAADALSLISHLCRHGWNTRSYFKTSSLVTIENCTINRLRITS